MKGQTTNILILVVILSSVGCSSLIPIVNDRLATVEGYEPTPNLNERKEEYYPDNDHLCVANDIPITGPPIFEIPGRSKEPLVSLSLLAEATDFLAPSSLYDDGFGAHIRIYYINGDSIEGEILGVEDSILTICAKGNEREQFFSGNPEALTQVRRGDVNKILIKGEQHVLPGMGKGLLLGSSAGVLGGFIEGDSPPFLPAWVKAYVYGVLLGAAGFVLVGSMGIASSTGDKKVSAQSDGDWNSLKEYSLADEDWERLNE